MREGAFSNRLMVGCEQRSRPLSGARADRQLEQRIAAQRVAVVGVLIPAGRKIDPGVDDPHDQSATQMGSGIEIVESGYRVPIPVRGRSLNWTLVPYVDPAPRERLDRFEAKMRRTLGLSAEQPVTSARLADAMRERSKRERLRECYDEIVPRGARRMHNRVSMSLYSGPVEFEEAQEWRHRVL